MAKQQQNPQNRKETRRVFLSFEFTKDAGRRDAFIADAKQHCDFDLIDKSLPAAEHSDEWRQAVKKRMKTCHVVIVLLGPDTHNAPGVKDELSLAGEVGCPAVQLMPKGKNYGLVAKNGAVCKYRWVMVNKMLGNPKAFANDPANRGK